MIKSNITKVLALLILTVVFSVELIAQSGFGVSSMADKKYNEFSYPEAIELYEHLYKKGDSSTHTIRRIADSYRLMREFDKAEPWYAKLVLLEDRTPEDVYHYVLILKSNEDYDNAYEWNEKYALLQPNDSRAKMFRKEKKHIDRILDAPKLYNISPISLNSKGEDFSPIILGDDIVFLSSRRNEVGSRREYNWNNESYIDIYKASKKEEAVYDVVNFSKRLNSSFHEGPLTFSEDGSEVFFTRNHSEGKNLSRSSAGVSNLTIYRGELEDGKWGNVQAVHFNNKEYSVGHPTLSRDGKVLYFVSDMPGGYGGIDIYSVTRENKSSEWGNPKNLGRAINTEGNEMFPFIHPTNGNLYFASDGHLGLGGLDIFTINLEDGENLVFHMGKTINSGKDDFGFFLSDDLKSGFFSSNRSGGQGADDIYRFDLDKSKKDITAQILLSEMGILTDTIIDYKSNMRYEKLASINDSVKQFDVSDLRLWEDSTLRIKLRYGKLGVLYDTIIEIDLRDETSIEEVFKKVILPKLELGMMNGMIKGIAIDQSMILEDSTLEVKLIYHKLSTIYSNLIQISLIDEGVQDSLFVIDLLYEKLPLMQDSIVSVNLNEIDLPHDSLFSLKFNYERLGAIEDSLMMLNITQVALLSDSIDEQLIYSRVLDHSKQSVFDVQVNYDGFDQSSYKLNASELYSLNRTSLLTLYKSDPSKPKEIERNKENAFVFVGTVFEEGTKIRLPNVRVIIRDRMNKSRQFVELTDAYGTFRDSVFGYQLNTLLSFDVFLKKEGYISKSVVFEEMLNEYGEVDLEEYLKKINLTKAEVGVEIGKAANLNPIYFDLDRSNIRPDAAIELDKIVEIMKELPTIGIELSSHTDSRATDRYNLALSQRRANATRDYLIAKGINAQRITSVGYGEKQLVNRCGNEVECSEEEHALNRRTEFEITSMKMNEPINKKSSKESNTNVNVEKELNSSVAKIISDKKQNNPKGREINQKEKLQFFCKIEDAETGEGISDIEIVISDIFDPKRVYTSKTNSRGEFSLVIKDYGIGERVYLDFLFSKLGHISKTFSFREKITPDLTSFIDLNSYFEDVYLVSANLNIDIGKAANILPIQFGLDQSDISREAAIELDKIAAILLEQPRLAIELGSHTDSRGDDAYNKKLSKRRADATMDYLVSQGISYSRITAVGYGESKPLNKCVNNVECSEEEHALNRRTEFIIKKVK